jgi:chromate transporter
MEKELVQERGWLTKQEMRDAIAVSQSLPGPLAIQVGIFAAASGGAWAGGWAFILPNFLIVAALGAYRALARRDLESGLPPAMSK